MKAGITYHIIGGGIAGLAAARFIKKKNKNSKVILYEASNTIGGRCFSFFDKKLGQYIDNATHVILGANHNVLNLMKDVKTFGGANFLHDNNISQKFWHFKEHILLSVFNTKPDEVCAKLVFNLLWKLLPFFPKKLNVFYSQGDLSEKLITPLTHYVDEFKTGYILKGVEAIENIVKSLIFNKDKVEISPEDKIICAVDAASYCKIFNKKNFEFNEITNIFYRTSTPLTLPQDKKFIATPQNTTDWVFICGNITAVTISNSENLTSNKDQLARSIWQEIRKLCGQRAAFLPPYKIMRYRRATIKQDKKNNSMRPYSALSDYKNMKVAGDWTMKDWPCCLEAAVISAKRAVK